VHRWHISSTETTSISLRAYEEPIRQYLHGEAGFPKDVVVMVTVCPDLASREGFYFPSAVKDSLHTAYAFLVRGVYIRVFTASNLPRGFRDLCCFTSPRALIFMRDCTKEALETWGKILRTSRPVGALADGDLPR
jgi:hypothetical protein